jgi:D-sedoheptulose 7-phosphate isomerase
MSEFSVQYLTELQHVLQEFPHENFDKMINDIMKSYEEEKHIFLMGNGGSGSTASHWACDLNKGCCLGLEKKFKTRPLKIWSHFRFYTSKENFSENFSVCD